MRRLRSTFRIWMPKMPAWLRELGRRKEPEPAAENIPPAGCPSTTRAPRGARCRRCAGGLVYWRPPVARPIRGSPPACGLRCSGPRAGGCMPGPAFHGTRGWHKVMRSEEIGHHARRQPPRYGLETRASRPIQVGCPATLLRRPGASLRRSRRRQRRWSRVLTRLRGPSSQRGLPSMQREHRSSPELSHRLRNLASRSAPCSGR